MDAVGRGEGDGTEGVRGSAAGGDETPFDLDDASFATPNCPSCVRTMTPASTPSGGVYWSCLHCGQSLLS